MNSSMIAVSACNTGWQWRILVKLTCGKVQRLVTMGANPDPPFNGLRLDKAQRVRPNWGLNLPTWPGCAKLCFSVEDKGWG